MTVMLATLVLNEIEWLPKLYAQHKDWPELERWVFVEAADEQYMRANPDMVNSSGLSVDGTTEYLLQLHRDDPRVSYVPLGYCSHRDQAQGKCAARNRYLELADIYEPGFVFVLDADEFYTKDAQAATLRCMRAVRESDPSATGFIFRQRHLWRPPSIADKPLMRYEVTGGYWSVPHARGWVWRKGMRYTDNHNTPDGASLYRLDERNDLPQCQHFGFASSLRTRAAKHRYYVGRGEGVRDKRQMYVDCRSAFETWKPGGKLPHGAEVKFYSGYVPECFAEEPGEKNPIDDPDYWTARLRRAIDRGKPVHEAVYITSERDWRYIRECSAAILRRFVTPDSTVLDAGCGYGDLRGSMPDLKSYMGVDLCPELVREARQRYPFAQFEVGDLNHLRWPDEHFDLAVCRSIDGMVKKDLGPEAWERMEKELLRVAKRLLLLGYEEPEKWRMLP